ncbi:nitrogenase molybdenum-iron protein subunit beta [Desertifilum sp. FACHB-1129]|uniref:Nitrogenase molybdenum-iron protein beta chain n=1 Tax=Desertifilum tharense IPPAS B-1220 TaxID=1781255 RepID=A0A1E5QEX3_9CYAN|nr:MULTISPECIES: nitrogenase molybdenum-iron protein subunit beta [Desertifilum]MDA0212688.1 nitrogenase molybdenum-iron protein subunit beta [Cyanobacteria bacterium FC1]MBD2313082.1 nitrogenase molybdenum-iron protein subunit beta [Desertifilum sp. FACHB-1129]MBD2324112.1 nitrogenase molybdenum-iron protein subunit beta [Desertifilum sp. FACHB-866]MBD2334047.1 nitrogenase molybdenum-iron protein subunit beta [Desertifilum sp. FACHB-868]OEJ73134.1 nitrogenase molybdenum-iron protein subunit b
MAQNVDQIKDHVELFHQPEYQELFKVKKQFEDCHSAEEVARVAEWTKSWEYREKNFAREALTINPAKACQPLGAIFAASGFEGTLPFVHGSQGCVAYFRTHLTRHFKEPFSAVSSSMTEDAAVFGGLQNMIDGLANSYELYKPKMIAMCTTCMAEVIGDDLQAFIKTSKEKGSIPEDFPVPYAHTPSFVGSHITGYDNMLKGILTNLTEGKKTETTNGKWNFIPGFDTYTANNRELRRILDLFGIDHTVLADNSDTFDSPNEGEFVMYQGKTTLEEAADSINAEGTIALQAYSTIKTREYIQKEWNQQATVLRPFGIQGTDQFLQKLSEISGKPIPRELEIERGRTVDAMTDSQAWIHGKSVALYGDPDLVYGLVGFLLELGAEPTHIVVTNSNEVFEAELQALLDSSQYGANAKIWGGKDLWHLRSLMFTEPVDLLIGNSYGKYLWRDTKTPLARIGYPIFDRHHLHRYSTLGYAGALNWLNWIINTILDDLDRNTIIPSKTDISYDLIR